MAKIKNYVSAFIRNICWNEKLPDYLVASHAHLAANKAQKMDVQKNPASSSRPLVPCQ